MARIGQDKGIGRVKRYDFIYWVVGFNAAFVLFREAFGILKYLYAFCLLWLCVRTTKKIFLQRKASPFPFYLKFFALVMAILCSIFVDRNVFRYTFFSAVPVLMLYYIKLGRPQSNEYKAFLAGYKLSIGIDFVYAGIQGLFMIRGISLNNCLYMWLGMPQHIRGVLYPRLSGLVWDPYVLGMFCATGYFLFRNRWVKAYILLLLVFSQSRSGLTGFAGAAFYYYLPLVKKKKNMPVVSAVAIVFLILVFAKVDLTRGFSMDSYGWVRIEYFALIPKIIMQEGNLLLLLFGGTPLSTLTRFTRAGLSIIIPKSVVLNMMECDWTGIFYGQGIVGLVAYVYMFIYVLKKQKNRSLKAVALAIFLGGVGYYFDQAIFANMLLFLPIGFREEEQVCFDFSVDYGSWNKNAV